MAGITPFSEAEQFEVRQAARTLFDGLYVTSDVREYVIKWGKYIMIFLDCIDREKGHFLRFPWEGTPLEMPRRSMELLHFLQQIFIERINAHYEAIKKDIRIKK